MLAIVAFGEALIDMMPEYPAGGADGMPPGAFISHPSGAPANVAVAAARLGSSAWFLGQVGNDVCGDIIADALKDYGVHTDYLERSDHAPTALAFVAYNGNGERRFSFYRNAAAALLYSAHNAPQALLTSGALFHFCSNTLTEANIAAATRTLLDLANQGGCLRSVDVNFRPNLWRDPAQARDAIWGCLERADVVKMNRDERQALYGDLAEDAVIGRLLYAGVHLIVITDGGKPVRFATRQHQGTIEPPAVDVVDTTAAGDAFVGGLLVRLAAAVGSANQLDAWLNDEAALRNALSYAARCGAYTVGRYGAYEALPTPPAVG